MKKRAFESLIKTSIDKGKKEKIIYDNGLDLISFLDDYSKINNILLKSIYGEELADIIEEFILDNIYDELEKHKDNYIIYDSNSKDIIADCSTLDGLYEYAEKTRLELIDSKFLYDIKPEISEEERNQLLKNLFYSVKK